MKFSAKIEDECLPKSVGTLRSYAKIFATYLVLASLVISIFYLSLLITSLPLPADERYAVDRAISLLEEKGFEDDAFWLRQAATFRRWDNWLNKLNSSENAYAATNFPFGIITLHPDFFNKAADDTERAMILLHEARHLRGSDERSAYEYVWRNRKKLGWTILTHGTTETYITIELQTREHSPELFKCRANLWNDCTAPQLAKK